MARLKVNEEQPQVGMEGSEVTPDVSSMIEGTRGSGQALPDNVRTQMEQGFGADFNDVRVHTGPKPDELSRTLSARAFTTGQDIFFKKGEYKLGSPAGKEVLAHELTHVLQQRDPGEGGHPSAQRSIELWNVDKWVKKTNSAKLYRNMKTWVQNSADHELAQAFNRAPRAEMVKHIKGLMRTDWTGGLFTILKEAVGIDTAGERYVYQFPTMEGLVRSILAERYRQQATGTEEVLALMRGSVEVEGYRVEPKRDLDHIGDQIGGYPIISGPVKIEVELSDMLVAELTNPSGYGWMYAKRCIFSPGIAVRFIADDSALDILFCFSCDELVIIDEEGELRKEDFDGKRARLVDIMKSVFPDDAEIQGLEA